MIITNNQWIKMELSDKMIEILSMTYSVWEYQMTDGDYKEAEWFLIENWYVLWDMFFKKFQPNEAFCNHIIWEIMSQRNEDTMLWNKILDNLFWANEKK